MDRIAVDEARDGRLIIDRSKYVDRDFRFKPK
jgi:hypothetical protein